MPPIPEPIYTPMRVGLHGALDLAVFDRLHRRRQGVLRVQIGLSDVALGHIQRGVETFDLARQFCLKGTDIERGDKIDAVLARDHIFPG